MRGAAAALEWYVPRRRRALERAARDAVAIQESTLLGLVRRARETEFGLAHDFGRIRSVADYQARVPVSEYAARPADVVARAPGGAGSHLARPAALLDQDGCIARARALAGRPIGTIDECWPHLGVFIHGGVTFGPYRALFDHWFGRPVDLVEVYPASEAFIGLQTERAGGLTLMLDYGVFYEFIPVEDLAAPAPRRHTVADLELDRAYAVALTTPAGLWSYLLGDTVHFVARDPLRLQITGRTRHFVNAFGENVIVEEVERAVMAACRRAHAEIVEFTVAPRYPSAAEPRGGHDWLVEFADPPRCPLEVFTRALDETLMATNADYRAQRTGSVGMVAPRLVELPAGTFYRWMRAEGKLGDQHKVPRVTNDRALADRLLAAAPASRCPERARPVAAH